LLCKTLIRHNYLDEAMDIYHDLVNALKDSRSRKPNFDQAFYTQLIKAHMLQHAVSSAIRLITEMRSQGLQPERQSVVCILQSCYRRADLDGARQALQGLELMGVRPSEHALQTVLRLYVKVEAWDDVFKLIFNMERLYGIQPTITTCSFVMQTLLKGKCADKVLELFTWMQMNNFEMDVSVFNIGLQACACEYDVVRGIEIAEEAMKAQIKPREGLIELLSTIQRRGGTSGPYEVICQLMNSNQIPGP